MRVPFDWSADDDVIAATDRAYLLAWSGDGAARWERTLAADGVAVGVAKRSVVAVEAGGRVGWYARDDGKLYSQRLLDRPAVAGAVSADGDAAVVTPSGVVRVGADLEVTDLGPGTCAAFAPDGRLAVGAGAVVRRFDARGRSAGEVAVPGDVRGVAWSPAGWLALTSEGLVRVPSAGSDVRPLLKTAAGPSEVGVNGDALAVSRDGALAAVRAGASVVVVDLVDLKVVGAVAPEPGAGGLGFGPSAWLGVALPRGDVNLVDLASGVVRRTEPHEGRPRNAWTVDARLNLDAVTSAVDRATSLPKDVLPPTPKGPYVAVVIGVVAFLAFVAWALLTHPP